MIEKPFYELDSETKKIILELKKKCQDLELGNCSFSYFTDNGEIDFYITQYNSYWELVVKQKKKDSCRIYWRLTDIYRITNNTIEYQNSEKDLI